MWDEWRRWVCPAVVPGLVLGLVTWLAGVFWLALVAGETGLRLLLAVAAHR